MNERLTRVEERLKAMDAATQLQAKEYERRLADLNHAHEEAQRVLATYLPRETWEEWLKEEASRREKNDAAMEHLRRMAAEANSAAIAVASTTTRNLAIATLVLGLIVLLANGSLGL